MKILCFGDSNTYGYDPRGYLGGRYAQKDRWVDLLATQTGHEVINAGSNGRSVPYSYTGIDWMNTDILVVMLGTNDLLQGATAKGTAARMEVFLTSLLPCCKQILLVAPPPMKRGAWVPTDTLVAESICLAAEYKLLAERIHIPFVDTRNWNVALCFDGVHFTEEGHHTFAKKLMEYL